MKLVFRNNDATVGVHVARATVLALHVIIRDVRQVDLSHLARYHQEVIVVDSVFTWRVIDRLTLRWCRVFDIFIDLDDRFNYLTRSLLFLLPLRWNLGFGSWSNFLQLKLKNELASIPVVV